MSKSSADYACVGVGVGPANLSLASLLYPHREISSIFLKKRNSFGSLLQEIYRRLYELDCLDEDYTSDRTPLVRRADGDQHVILAGGRSAAGFRLAPGIAEAALDLLPSRHRMVAKTGGRA